MNLMYEMVSEAHREVKNGRTVAALYDAQKKAEAEKTEDPTKDANSTNASRAPTPTLTENPMLVTREERCPNCLLPRLFRDPSTLAQSERAKYCGNAPRVQRPEHDVHGNPFFELKPLRGQKKKPPKQSQQQLSAAPSPDSSSSSPPPTPATSSFSNSAGPVEPLTKPAYPNVKCPNTKCTRYIGVRRLAAHIETCLFNKGRRAAKDAADRLEASSSRAGTPKPDLPSTSGIKRAREDDGQSTVKKKKSKTDPSPKKKDGGTSGRSGTNQPSKLQNGESVDDKEPTPSTPTSAQPTTEDSIKVDNSGKKASLQKPKPKPVDTATAEGSFAGKNAPKSGGLKGSTKVKKEKTGKLG